MWPRLVGLLLGLGLMAAPGVFGYAGAARINDLVVGPIAAAAAAIAISGVTRALRWIDVAAGAWMVVGTWFLGRTVGASVMAALAGLLMAASGVVRGKVSERFGGGWSELWRPRPHHHPGSGR